MLVYCNGLYLFLLCCVFIHHFIKFCVSFVCIYACTYKCNILLYIIKFNYVKWKCSSLSHVWLLVIPWTVAHQVPLSMEFSRQEHWSGLPFPSPGDLPNPGIENLISCISGEFFNRLSHSLSNCYQIYYFYVVSNKYVQNLPPCGFIDFTLFFYPFFGLYISVMLLSA